MLRKKNHLIAIVTVLLISGFVVTTLANYYVVRETVRKQIAENELPLTSDNVYSEIQRDLLSSVFISSLMATDTFVRDWLIQGERDSDQITNYLNEIQQKYNTFTSFLVSEQTGVYYHSSGPLKTVSPEEPRDKWYYRVRRMKADYEINIDPDLGNKDAMTIFVNYRIYDYEGKFIGATGVGLTISAVKKLIERYKLQYGREIFFLNTEGRVMLHGKEFPDHENCLLDMNNMAPLVKKTLKALNGAFIMDGGRGPVLYNVRYIPEFDWVLVVGQSESGALHQIHNAVAVNFFIYAFVTIIVLILVNLAISYYQKRLEEMASTDKLTGIYNRQAFDILLSQAIKEAGRRGDPLSLIMLDLDHFKKINDSLGHLAGDAVLKNLVKTMERSVRKSDALGRWGGEEFLALLHGCPLDDAFLIAEKIRTTVCSSVTTYNQAAIKAAVSIGVAQYQDCESPESLLNRADMALYKAKEGGRNRTEKHTGEPSDCLLEKRFQ
ncbi:diguanylate cyclase (GGDEF) domain-containing protein [Desulfatibacillum alkenivorans DSM 16219]|jgi:diguanylate cyclase (GGDEF)-like protein|uniref:diguanylate cyclase n=1 Tax=Desulfatibacillum alkenivorans DSM 16219 TaxID=1121393 RepID=A0A1M6IIG7_9BACT|nr:sensor domain-containing diguanylate cyclase [Desulfatibacillum alkenivorans]SHJ34229.1 diguanylate cyclase (GGDEF) domain-containing protein [Desulfatibacillum alkenivorans DSM 16219]